MAYRLTVTATSQIETVMSHSLTHHRSHAADLSAFLLQTAIEALGQDPALLGTRPIPRAPGLFAYPARLISHRIAPSARVAAPRHLIIYRLANDGIVEILGLAHDRMVLSRAARTALHGG